MYDAKYLVLCCANNCVTLERVFKHACHELLGAHRGRLCHAQFTQKDAGCEHGDVTGCCPFDALHTCPQGLRMVGRGPLNIGHRKPIARLMEKPAPQAALVLEASRRLFPRRARGHALVEAKQHACLGFKGCEGGGDAHTHIPQPAAKAAVHRAQVGPTEELAGTLGNDRLAQAREREVLVGRHDIDKLATVLATRLGDERAGLRVALGEKFCPLKGLRGRSVK